MHVTFSDLTAFVAVVAAYYVIANATGSDVEIDPKLSLVFGLGIERPDLVFPVRYFYVQAVDSTGRNLSVSPPGGGSNVFDVRITAPTGSRPCRTWTQVLDLADGTVLVRYRLFEPCDGLVISIVLLPVGTHVARSPYHFRGRFYHEECNCPMTKRITWKERMQCPTYRQIEDDLEPFRNGVDVGTVLDIATRRFSHAGSHSICNYVVLNNEVYRRCYGEHVGFKMFVDSVLLSLARKVRLPDLDLLVNLGDWPLVKKNDGTLPIPVFSWCGSNETYDIVLPTYDLTESTLHAMGRVSLDVMSVLGNSAAPNWPDKIERGFWRGRDSRRERLQLVFLSKRKRPDLIDASVTNFFFFRELLDEYGPEVPRVSFFDFFRYKYQLSVDGTVAAYRMPYLLAGGAVVFKQNSTFYEHFYRDLRPDVHYVHFDDVIGDLVPKLEWAKRNDDVVRRIAAEGRKYVRNNLMPRDVFCYHVVLLENYAKLIRNGIEVRPEMEHVPQEVADCDCERSDENARDEL